MIGMTFNGIERRSAPGAPRLAARFCRDTGGAIAILMALLIPVVIGMMGLTIDVGVWYAEKRSLQDTADAAALAGGAELANGSSTATVEAAATVDATRNDFDATTDTIDIHVPPDSGPNAGNLGSIEVILTRRMPMFFTSAFFQLIGAETQQFNARARSVVNTIFADDFCILGLDNSASKAVDVGTATVTLGCGIAVNSDADNALYIGGTGSLAATSITTVGLINISGGGSLTSDAPPRRGSKIPDPYIDLEIPEFSGCNAGSIGPGNTGITASGNLDADYFGGIMVICGGLSVDPGDTLNLGPGVYIIDQGDFKINANASIVGEGVTIILTSSGLDSKIGKVQVTGGADIELSAPTSDPAGAPGYSGVLFYQNRDVEGQNKNNFFAGGAELDLEGALYFPSEDLSFRGGSDIGSGCTQLIAKKVQITGEAVLETNCNDSGTRAMGRLKASLGE